jgi:uncharacterized protein HemY
LKLCFPILTSCLVLLFTSDASRHVIADAATGIDDGGKPGADAEATKVAIQKSSRHAPIAALFRPGGDDPQKWEDAERYRSQRSGNDRTSVDYILGRLLQQQGKKAEARPYLEEAAQSLGTSHLTRALAAVALRELDDQPVAPPPEAKPQ